MVNGDNRRNSLKARGGQFAKASLHRLIACLGEAPDLNANCRSGEPSEGEASWSGEPELANIVASPGACALDRPRVSRPD